MNTKTSYVQAFECVWENLKKVAKTNTKSHPGIQYVKRAPQVFNF